MLSTSTKSDFLKPLVAGALILLALLAFAAPLNFVEKNLKVSIAYAAPNTICSDDGGACFSIPDNDAARAQVTQLVNNGTLTATTNSRGQEIYSVPAARFAAVSESVTRASSTGSDSERPWYDIGGHLEDFGDWLIAKILAVFVAIAGGLLAAIGWGFDQAIKYTILDFSGTYALFESGVETAWSGFRDVANIAMIAMFVFVAFAVILNSQTYGLKQFGVRILVVALLINFSLFFTKAIIDVSNITAIQFRKAIQVTDSSGNDAGIAAAFMQHAGLTTSVYASASKTIESIANDSWGKAFLYTFMTVIFFSALLVVLLYGFFLLVARMVILLILMFTSSAAFAAYMIPKGHGWWIKWWDALLRNALFAPLFMMMLWGTVNIMKGLGGEQKLTFDQLIQNNASGWTPALNMMVIVGLLYASTKVASELSIAGSGFAKKISTKGFSAALQAAGIGGAFGLVGRLGRGTIGSGAQSVADSAYLREKAVSGMWATRLAARGSLAAAKRVAGTSFDFRDTQIAKNLEKATGGLSLGKGVGNLESHQKTEAKYLADGAKAAGEIAKKTAEESVRGTAGAPVGDSAGSAENMMKGMQELNEQNQQAMNELVSAQRQTNANETTPSISVTNTEAPPTPEASAGQQQKNELGERDANIENLTSDIQGEGKSRTDDGFSYTFGNALSQIPSAKQPSAGDSAAISEAMKNLQGSVDGLRGSIERGAAAQAAASEAKSTDPAKAAEAAFIERYREKGGITRDSRTVRGRIADSVVNEGKKSDTDKNTEKLEKKIAGLEKKLDKKDD